MSDALETWREKLAFLQSEEAISVDASEKFALSQQIKEAQTKIAGLELRLQRAERVESSEGERNSPLSVEANRQRQWRLIYAVVAAVLLVVSVWACAALLGFREKAVVYIVMTKTPSIGFKAFRDWSVGPQGGHADGDYSFKTSLSLTNHSTVAQVLVDTTVSLTLDGGSAKGTYEFPEHNAALPAGETMVIPLEVVLDEHPKDGLQRQFEWTGADRPKVSVRVGKAEIKINFIDSTGVASEVLLSNDPFDARFDVLAPGSQ